MRRAGQQGPVTRLMSCTAEDLRKYKGLDLMPTFVAPSFKDYLGDGDKYAAYNKPGAIMAWLEVSGCFLSTEHPFCGSTPRQANCIFVLHSCCTPWRKGCISGVLQEQEPTEDFIMIVDADNIMRFPFDPFELRVEPGMEELQLGPTSAWPWAHRCT